MSGFFQHCVVRFTQKLIHLLCYVVFCNMSISHLIHSMLEGHMGCVFFGRLHASNDAIDILIPTRSTAECISVGCTQGGGIMGS